MYVHIVQLCINEWIQRKKSIWMTLWNSETTYMYLFWVQLNILNVKDSDYFYVVILFCPLHTVAANCKHNVNIPFSDSDCFMKRTLAFHNPFYGWKQAFHPLYYGTLQMVVERKPFKPLCNHSKLILQSSKHKFCNAFKVVWAKTITQCPQSITS